MGIESAWVSVAGHVTRRMSQLGFATQAELARRAGISTPTARIFMTGERREEFGYPGTPMRIRVCGALGWTPASIDHILAGGSPIEVEDISQRSPTDLSATEERLRAVERAVDRLERRLPELQARSIEATSDLGASIERLADHLVEMRRRLADVEDRFG